MNNHLRGHSAIWVTWDVSLAISAAVRTMLASELHARQVALQFYEARSVEEAVVLVNRYQATLMTLIAGAESALAVAKALWQVRFRSPATIRVVYMLEKNLDSAPLWLEAGAQILVDEIPSLQRIMPRIVKRTKMKTSGCHPLTLGLVERLPWSDDDT